MVARSSTDRTTRISRVRLWVMVKQAQQRMPSRVEGRCVSESWLERNRCCNENHESTTGNGTKRVIIVDRLW